MTTIQVYHISVDTKSWTQVKTVTLHPQITPSGVPEYRFAMYPLLNCQAIETVQFKIEPGRIRRTCAFLVWDECFGSSNCAENQLLKQVGLSVKGPVLILGGRRSEKNKHLYHFASPPDDLLRDVGKLRANLLCGWIMRNEPPPVPESVSKSAQVICPQEYAWEWHEQNRAIHKQILARMLIGTDYCPDNPDHDHMMQRFEPISDVVCPGCGRTDVRLKRCGDCRVTGYCSVTCQKKDRRSHVAFCKQIVANGG